MKASKVTLDDVRAWTAEHIKSLSNGQVATLKFKQLAVFSSEKIAVLEEDVLVIKSKQIQPLDAHALAAEDARFNDTPMGAIIDKREKARASIRAKDENPFRVIKRQLWNVKVDYRGLKKSTAQLHRLFALSNLWTARRSLLEVMRA